MEAGTFAFLVTDASLARDSKKRVANYLSREKEGGRERGKSNPGKLCGKDSSWTEVHRIQRRWLGGQAPWRPFQAEEMLWANTERPAMSLGTSKGYGTSNEFDMWLEQRREWSEMSLDM